MATDMYSVEGGGRVLYTLQESAKHGGDKVCVSLVPRLFSSFFVVRMRKGRQKESFDHVRTLMTHSVSTSCAIYL